MRVDGLGLRVLKEIASVWQVGESVTSWHEQGFDWTPGSHVVNVRTSPDLRVRDTNQDERWRVWVEVEVLKSSHLHDPQSTRLLSAMSRFITSTYSLVY